MELGSRRKKLQNNIEKILHTEHTYFPEFSLTLLLFIHRLYQRCIEKEVKALYFLSREGKLLKQLFDLYQEYIGGKIKTYYLLASRQSTAPASLKPLTEENFYNLFSRHDQLSIENFCQTYRFNLQSVKKITDQLGIDFYRVQSLAWSTDFKKLLEHPDFQAFYEQHRITQKKEILTYLKRLDIREDQTELFLVDVGWRGMIQDNLNTILSHRTKITGFYLGLHQGGIINEHNKKLGVLFDYRKKWEKLFNIYKGNRALYEILLTADHDSPIGYKYGKAVLSHTPKERAFHSNHIQPLQHIYLTLFEKILAELNQYNFSVQQLENFFCKKHLRMILKPTQQELSWFNQLYRFENYGIFDYFQTRFQPRSQINYYFHRFMRSLKFYHHRKLDFQNLF